MALNPTFNTPILLIVFNRPEETTKLWAEIKKLKPKKLYVAADGPRPNNNGDMIKCMQTREIVTKGLDWDCDMKLMFQEHNLGCGIAIKEALMWFFKNEPEGIILEDDCIPHQDFFSFCASLLEKYRYEEKVFMICGNNINNNSENLASDYFFTYIPSAWGWATWRRSILKYDFNLDSLKEFENKKTIARIFNKKSHQRFWLNFFNEIKSKKINNWDYQLAFTSFKEMGLCLRPKYNLITNLGTTFIANGKEKHILNSEGLKIQTHPEKIEVNREIDEKIMQKLVSPIYRIKMFLKKINMFNIARKIYKNI